MQKTIIRFITFCVASAGGAAQAQELITPSWAKPVQGELAQNLYPGFASLVEQSGRATVQCRIEGDGHPYLCEVVDEAPHGLGFGAAARVIIASAEVKAARLDGRIVGRSIRTTVHFALADDTPFGHWTGPEPSAAKLVLARQVVLIMPNRPTAYRDRMMDGLDFDRRQVVGDWISELMPSDPDRENEVLAVQLARLFDEDELGRIMANQPVDSPSEDDFLAACPDPTPQELAAIEEIKRRYCDRWTCNTVPGA